MMKKKTLWVPVLTVLLLLPSTVSAVSPGQRTKTGAQNDIDLPPCDDSHIISWWPNENYGDSYIVALRNKSIDWNFDVRTLIMFNLSCIPPGTQISYAHLNIYYWYYVYGNPSGRPYTIYRIKEPWNEETVCWSNQPNHHDIATGVTDCPPQPGVWIDWNVTSDVQAFLNGTMDNYGWIIADETTGYGNLPYAFLYSKETTDDKPYLRMDIDINLPPFPARHPIPDNGSTNVARTTDLSWVGVDPNVNESLTFDVYFGTTSPPSLVSTNQTATTYDLPILDYNTQYFWRIDTWDSHGEFAEGDSWSFTTKPDAAPSVPKDPHPPWGAVDVNLTPILSWSECTDPDGDPIVYDVYFGTNLTPPLVSLNQTGTTFRPEPLACATEYFWRIVVHDRYGGYTQGALWTFTTLVNHFPNPPMINGPIQSQVQVLHNYTVVATDPENQDLFYQVDWGDGTLSTWYGPVPSGTVITLSHAWQAGGRFTIRARARDTAGAISDWGYLVVRMPYVPPTFLQWLYELLERFPNAFPFLRSLLGR